MTLNVEAFKDHPWIALIATAVVVVVPALALVLRARIAARARVDVARLQYGKPRRRLSQPRRMPLALDGQAPKLLEAPHRAIEARRDELAGDINDIPIFVEV